MRFLGLAASGGSGGAGGWENQTESAGERVETFMLEKMFKLTKHNTNVRTEILAGMTTFFTMAYILVVNPGMLADGASKIGMDFQAVYNGVFFATCIASFIGTILLALYAKIPFAQAPGMGLNAFFSYTVMVGYGMSYSEALAIVFISGILFISITLGGIRKSIVECLPSNIKIAISAGIGLFLAFLGLQSAGLTVPNESTLVGLVNFSAINTDDQAVRTAIWGAILSIVGLIIIASLSQRRVKGAILIGIITVTILGVPVGVTQLPTAGSFQIDFGGQFADFVEVSLFSFTDGFKSLLHGKGILEGVLTIAVLVISFSLVDIFDTIGTLLGTAKKADLLDENGNMENMNQALLCDAIATTAGAALGTSTITTFVESAAGIGEGGRTGLTSLTTSLMFLLAIIIAPFVGIVPSAATAPALIYVGSLMISSIKDLDWKDASESLPAFLTIAMMPLTYSIANGIAFGLISHVLIKFLSGKYKEIRWLTVVLACLFVLRFFLMAM